MFLGIRRKIQAWTLMWEINFSCPIEIQPVLFFKASWWSTLKSICCYAWRVWIFPLQFQSLEIPFKAFWTGQLFSVLCMVSPCTLDCTVCLASVRRGSCLQTIPEWGTPVAAAFRGPTRDRKVPAGTGCHVHVGSAACSQLCPQQALPAQDSANIHGMEVEEVNGTLIPGCGTHCATFRPGLTHTQSPLGVT